MTKIIGTTSGGAVVPDSFTSTIYSHWKKPLPWSTTTAATTAASFSWWMAPEEDELTPEERKIVDDVIEEFGGKRPVRVNWGHALSSATPTITKTFKTTAATFNDDNITLTYEYDET